MTSGIEALLWMAILTGMGKTELGGFGRESYLAYALWGNFIGRVTANWMYEYMMMEDIETGRVNSILVRPISFFEFYLSQFIGYKGLILLSSIVFPIVTCSLFGAPVIWSRLPLMILGLFYYLIFCHLVSFTVASMAFYLNKAHAFTMIKNMALWIFSGELIPLDLFPEPLKSWIISLPFASAVYLPVGYVIGRVDFVTWRQGLMSVTIGILVMSVVAQQIWSRGVRQYTGTGA